MLSKFQIFFASTNYEGILEKKALQEVQHLETIIVFLSDSSLNGELSRLKAALSESKNEDSALNILQSYPSGRWLLSKFGTTLAAFERSTGLSAKVQCYMSDVKIAVDACNDKSLQKSLQVLVDALKGCGSIEMAQIFNKGFHPVSELLSLALTAAPKDDGVMAVDVSSIRFNIIVLIASLDSLSENCTHVKEAQLLRSAFEAAVTVSGSKKEDDLSLSSACSRLAQVKRLDLATVGLSLTQAYDEHLKSLLTQEAVQQVKDVLQSHLSGLVGAVKETFGREIFKSKVDFSQKPNVEVVLAMKSLAALESLQKTSEIMQDVKLLAQVKLVRNMNELLQPVARYAAEVLGYTTEDEKKISEARRYSNILSYNNGNNRLAVCILSDL